MAIKKNINEAPNKLIGGKGDDLTAKKIADKFDVPITKINAQIKKGIPIEMEHTKDRQRAIEIVMDHMAEFPDYYDRLKKMETLAKRFWKNKKINEDNKSVIKKIIRENFKVITI